MGETGYGYQHHDTRPPWQQTLEYPTRTTQHLQSSGSNQWQYDQPGVIADFAPYHNEPAQISNPAPNPQAFIYNQPRVDPSWQQQHPQPLRSNSYAAPHDRSHYLPINYAQAQQLSTGGGHISPSFQSPNASFTGYEYGGHSSPAFQPPANYTVQSPHTYSHGALQAAHGQGWYPTTPAYDPEAEGQMEHTFDEATRYGGRQGG